MADQSFAPINYRMRFPALDGVRAVAVLMVFAFHYGGGAHRGPLLKVADAIRLQGWVGVDVFFVLSGFLITGVLYDTRRDSRFFSRFFARRSVRIFPVYYLVALLLLVLTPVFHYSWHAVHLLFLVYLGNIPGAFMPAIYQLHARWPAADVYLGHLWSLFVEEQFYLLWPLLVWGIGGRVKLMWTAFGLSTVALTLRVWLVLGSGVDLRGGWLMNMLPFHMDTLLIGGVLALLLRGERAAGWQKLCGTVFAVSTVTLMVLFLLDSARDATWISTVGFTLIALASAGLIGSTLRRESVTYKFFSLRALRIMGRYSYGFYVYHLLFASGWAALTTKLVHLLHSAAIGTVTGIAITFWVTFLVSKLSYDFFEVRFLRWKRWLGYDSAVREERSMARPG